MSGLIESIFDKFSSDAVFRGGEYWFSPSGAIKVLREAHQWSLALLGFDAADLSETATKPDLENCWDYSSRFNQIHDPYQHAIQFIEAKSNTGLRFSIVLSDTSEPRRPIQ